MADSDKNRQPSEHYLGKGVELTDSAKASVKDVERIRGMGGQAKEAATQIARKKRRNAAALAASKQR